MKIWDTYKSLTPEQKTILQEKQLNANRTPGELISLLRPLAEYDKLSDTVRTKFGCTAAFLFLASFVGFAVTAATPILAIPLFLILFGGAVFLTITTVKLSKLDVSNNMREFAVPILAILREDITPGETVQVRLDLRSPTHKDKLVDKSAPYEAGVYHKVIDSNFEDPWFEGDAELADGSRLHWSVVDQIKEMSKTKKTPRGKYKTKTKYKKRSLMSVQVALPEKRYGLVDRSPGGDAKLQIKEGEKRTSFKLSRTYKTNTIDPMPPSALIDLIAEAYRRTGPAAQRSA